MGAIVKLTDTYVETEIDGEVLLVDMAGGMLFALDGTARDAWRLIDGRRDLAAIAAELAQSHAGEADRIAADCADFVAELRGAGLVAEGAAR